LVGIRDPTVVNEGRVALCQRACLQGQSNEVAVPSLWKPVLIREEAIVGGQLHLVAPKHGLGQEKLAHAPGDRSMHGLREKEPGMGTVARPGSLQGRRNPVRTTSRKELLGVALPFVAIEVNGQEPACLVAEEGVNADHLASRQVGSQYIVRQREQHSILTIAAS